MIIASMDRRQDFVRKELDVMVALQVDNGFVINNLALSSSCDLSLFQIISRGQQTRAFACFARAYHNQKIYINHEQFENPYLLIKKQRSESSFPDPLWIPNPSLESLRAGTIGPTVSPPPPAKKRRVSVLSLLGKTKPTTVPKSEKRYGGGFVIDPDPGFYHRPEHAVVTLDFSSLYPSIMKGYRTCFMAVCYDEQWLHDPRATKVYVPLDDQTCCVLISSYDGVPSISITDRIVDDVMQNRKRVREEMKRTTDPFLRQSLDAQQLCCKILQNAFYGACGSETFGIPCTALAASVCVIGQWMNKTVRHRAMILGGRCVYGDTDSVMIQFPTDPSIIDRKSILNDICRQARDLERTTTELFPPPNAVEFEPLKLPHYQTTKKKLYGGREYPPDCVDWTEQQSSLLIKGFAFKKRDRCTFVYRLGYELMCRVFSNTHTDAALHTWFMEEVVRTFHPIPTDSQLSDFIITCQLNTEYKQENVLALHLATQYEKETGTRPRPGRRLRYIIGSFGYETRKHFQCAVTPATFLRNSQRLDASYYLEKQLLLPIKQALDLKPKLFQHIQRSISALVVRHTVQSKPLTFTSSMKRNQ
jgi:DNA polymerase elongation subunit (family B)